MDAEGGTGSILYGPRASPPRSSRRQRPLSLSRHVTQADVYRIHEPWLKESSPEAVRRAMLEVRRWNEGRLEDFDNRLRAANQQLEPEA
jgi:hypothetical protein